MMHIHRSHVSHRQKGNNTGQHQPQTTHSLFVQLVADGWCWFVLREKYYWLVGDDWFILREKYCWLVADKPREQYIETYLRSS
jgi:hypothetical protein